MKVALVYDRVNKFGGAERVLLALHKIWPEAPLYTSVYHSRSTPWASVFRVIPSFLQRFPLAKTNHEIYPLLMPLAFESFNFDEYDVVISVTSEAAKGIITKPKTLHLCYCLTPTRYLWSGYEEYFNSPLGLIAEPWLKDLKKWDLIASERPDEILAISETVSDRIEKYYQRKSEVIYPPVNTRKFTIPACRQAGFNLQFSNIKEKYFLVVSRLVKYKKVDLAIEAFNALGWKLKIVGIGRGMSRLKKMAKKNIEFLGQLTDKELLSYYQNCQAVIFCQEEDFGIVPLEAQACGKPVIAFEKGGAKETVIEGKTGLFFEKQTRSSLVEALKRFKPGNFKSKDCRKQVEKFSQEKFIKKFKKKVEEKWQMFLKNTYTL